MNENKNLRFVNFNQDFGCFVVGTEKGYRVFNSDPLRPKERNSEEQSDDFCSHPVILAELLFRCNYVAFVTEKEPKKLRILDETSKVYAVQLEFASDIAGIRLRRDRIVVILRNEIKVFEFTSEPSCLHTFQTTDNPRGICSLSPSSSNGLLAFPSIDGPGIVKLVDLVESGIESQMISAHETSLRCITINIQGTKLATSSEKGTLIRLFDTKSGQIIKELRRGSQSATIYSINFSADSSFLCASSSHGTIHVFACDKKDRPVNSSGQNKNKLSSLVADGASNLVSKNILPKYFSSEWSFARIEVPGGGPSICAFGSNPNTVLAICSVDGSYHKFILDEKGGYSRDVYKMIFESGDI